MMNTTGRKLACLALVALAFTACDEAPPAPGSTPAASTGSDGHGKKLRRSKPEKVVRREPRRDARARSVDPRRGGFEIGLGEWAVTPEAESLRPGLVTFVIHNRGTMPHGFEIELEGESSGHGSGDLFKAESELLPPGGSTRMQVRLTEAVYKIECLVDGHDDMGMERPLEVSARAPLVKVRPPKPATSGSASVAISNFAFSPDVLEIDAGTVVEWDNEDPAPHTVTGRKEEFDSGTLDEGGSFSFKFDERGTYNYRCEIHPTMEGQVKVR